MVCSGSLVPCGLKETMFAVISLSLAVACQTVSVFSQRVVRHKPGPPLLVRSCTSSPVVFFDYQLVEHAHVLAQAKKYHDYAMFIEYHGNIVKYCECHKYDGMCMVIIQRWYMGDLFNFGHI